MKRDELEERIAEFPQWIYKFEFDDGVSTPLPDSRVVNRHEQRRRYFFDALVRLFGGSLRGRRVLDLGCNAGFWSLQAIEAGADFVLGIDAQRVWIDEANLVFEAKGIDPARYRFEQANIFEHGLVERFDVVLCLALMDQVSKPVELFEVMSGVGAEILVIETELSRAPSAFFELASPPASRKVVDRKMVLLPSRQAVIELAAEFGYNTVPLARNMTDYTGMKDYQHRRRLAFFCSQGMSLSGLAVEETSVVPWWLAQLDPRRGLERLRG